MKRTLAMIGLLGSFAVSCALEQPPAASTSGVATVPLHLLARNIADYRGRIVRTCGSQFQPARRGDISYWVLSVRDPTSPFNFPARVLVLSCSGDSPRRDEGGCVAGRIAREDGSLADPDVEMITDHEIVSYEWFLHPQCPSR